MALTKSVSYTGQQSVATLRGSIRLEEGRGRLVVYDRETNINRSVVDIDGTHVYNANGDEVTRLEQLGLRIFRPDGTESARGGVMPDGTTNFIAVKPTKTVDGAFS